MSFAHLQWMLKSLARFISSFGLKLTFQLRAFVCCHLVPVASCYRSDHWERRQILISPQAFTVQSWMESSLGHTPAAMPSWQLLYSSIMLIAILTSNKQIGRTRRRTSGHIIMQTGPAWSDGSLLSKIGSFGDKKRQLADNAHCTQTKRAASPEGETSSLSSSYSGSNSRKNQHQQPWGPGTC